MMQTYSNEDYLCLTEDEKMGLYFEQVISIEKLNEELDIAQEGLLELQKELSAKRHAFDENEKLFLLAKELKDENEQLKKNSPQNSSVNQELESLKQRYQDESAIWHERLMALDHEKQLIFSEKGYLSQLISEYEKEMEQIKLQAIALNEQNMLLHKEAEALKQEVSQLQIERDASQEDSQPPLSELNYTIELRKKEEENALLRSEVGKIKLIVVQGMREAKELKTKYLTLLQHYEESTIKYQEQENLALLLQGQLHETNLLKNRFEQEASRQESEAGRLQSEVCDLQSEVDRLKNEVSCFESEVSRFESEVQRLEAEIGRQSTTQAEIENAQDAYEKELQLTRQLLSKKVKECTVAQEKLEEVDHSYQEKIQRLISDYQDRIESFQVQIQKLHREKESIESESLREIKVLLDPLMEKVNGRLRTDANAGFGAEHEPSRELEPLILDWNFHRES